VLHLGQAVGVVILPARDRPAGQRLPRLAVGIVIAEAGLDPF
jgi:hypothetical protein